MTLVQAALQRLVVLAAAVVLLGHGGLELAPRLAAAGAGAVTTASGVAAGAGRATSPRPAAESQPVSPVSTLRLGLAAAVPTGGDTAARPGASLSIAPHLVARPVARPPSRSYVLEVGGGASGRAPPAPAGT
jgi:hypothetical protein